MEGFKCQTSEYNIKISVIFSIWNELQQREKVRKYLFFNISKKKSELGDG
jgi:hypothetical protein